MTLRAIRLRLGRTALYARLRYDFVNGPDELFVTPPTEQITGVIASEGSSPTLSAFEVNSLCIAFGERKVLKSVSIDIRARSVTAIIGPSGCGKSTLLRLIIRLIEPDSGSIEFNGEPITADTIGILRRRIGYVIQEGGLFPHLTARANVLLMARHVGKSVAEMQSRLAELCELTRLSVNLLSRYPVELSGGQRQRVGLMRALMLSPELLLLDEPLGALDPLVRAALQKDLKEIFVRLQQTVVFVTHDLAEAIYFGDEIVLMNDGRVVQRGSVNDLREKPADPFVSEFINAQRGVILT
jgi:osmoprotectant transport system ATP-binding protein